MKGMWKVGLWSCAVALLGCAAPDTGEGLPETEDVAEASQALNCVTIRNGGQGNVFDATIAFDPADPTRASANFGTSLLMQVGALGTGTTQSLLRFDLSPIPSAANIVSSTFTFQKYTSPGLGNVLFHKVTQGWSESTVTWSSFAAAYSPVIETSVNSALVPNGPVNLDLTSLTQSWVSGAVPNHGLLLEQVDPGRTSFAASDASVVTLKPRLAVCYTLTATCSDGVQNGSETGVDCGGSCPVCTCQPTAELCNGLDDNCDGQVDEGNPEGGQSCSTGGAGLCAAGTTACVSGALQCNQTSQPAAEDCDGLFDEDCDGVVDNGCACVNGSVQSCYTGAPNTLATGVCTAGSTTCSGGQWGACVGEVLPSAEACNGLDDDCNGAIDDGNPGGGGGCATGQGGVCAQGTALCANGVIVCAQDNAPSVETCNGIDDDCDGSIDNGNPGSGLACTTGQSGVCAAGTTTCAAGAIVCAQTMSASAESCNGLDDDCDGAVDNGNPGGGQACNTGLSGACGAGTTLCSGGAVTCSQTVFASAESCNGVDDDCNGQVDELGVTSCGLGACGATVTACVNGTLSMCIPGDPSPEVCDGLYDEDCDGVVDNGCACVNGSVQSCYTGAPGTLGVGICAPGTQICVSGQWGACANEVLPGVESCNGADDDCDGQTDQGNPGGGGACQTGSQGVCASGTMACVAGSLSCLSNLQASAEVCDGLDNDCNGTVDNGVLTTFYLDGDGDGYGSAAFTAQACSAPNGYVANAADCNDASASIKPGAAEVCNGIDDNCNGTVDEGVTTTYWQDADGDGFGNPNAPIAACSQPSGYVSNFGDCNDAKFSAKPGAVEVCNGIDDNCNGLVDELVTFTYYLDTDGDGYGVVGSTTQACSVPAGYASLSGDCNNALASVNPGAAETCNFTDDNCNGQVDEGDPGGGAQCATGLPGACSTGTFHCVSGAVSCVQDTSQTWYLDSDDDGYGVTGSKKTQCTQPAGYAPLPNDCDDADEEINPGAPEVCDGVDNNCDNLIDNSVQNPPIWYFDGDDDGYGAASPTVAQCTQPNGYVPSGGDCNDNNAAVSPAAAETCNGLDDNCNSVVDEGNPNSGASCSTGLLGVCSAGVTACFGGGIICNQTNASGAEACNNLDDDCDGQTDEGGVCTCLTGQTQSCYSGPPGTLGVGLCAAGVQTCNAGVWGSCAGAVVPTPDNCAQAGDEDCDGLTPTCTGSSIWAQKFGGSSSDPAYGIATDAQGNVYVTGYFQGTVNFGAGSVTTTGLYDIFVLKLNSNGALIWAKTFGGSSYDIGYDIAVDSAGAVYVTGVFRSTTINFGGGALSNAGSTSYYDTFLLKLDSLGNHLWSKRFGGTTHDYSWAVEVDHADNVVIGGYFQSTSMNFGGSTLATAGSYDPWLAKFDTNGNHVWSNRWGGSSADYAYDLAITPNNEVLFTGRFQGTVNFGGGNLVSAGSYDVFLLKLSSAGSYMFAKKFGDSDVQIGYAVASDNSGNILMTGAYQSKIDFGGGNLSASTSYYDIYAAKLDSNGNYLWAKTFGSSTTHDYSYGCAFDPAGNAVLTGIFQGSINFGGSTLTSGGGNDPFIVKLNSVGAHVYSKNFGNSSAQYGRRVTTDLLGNTLWVGYFQGSLDFGLGTLTSAGSNDIFVAKLAP